MAIIFKDVIESKREHADAFDCLAAFSRLWHYLSYCFNPRPRSADDFRDYMFHCCSGYLFAADKEITRIYYPGNIEAKKALLSGCWGV